LFFLCCFPSLLCCLSTDKKRQKKKNSEAEAFKQMNIKYPTPREDGHVGRSMQWKTMKTNTIKLARRRKHNLQNLLNNTVQQDAKI
jgi:hypothetical protein